MKTPSPKTGRTRVFRGLAILLGLLVPTAAELLCRIVGWGASPVYEDPFVGFKGVQPLFVENREKGVFEVASAKLKFFSPESFAARKPAGTYRIFCLGGSTVKGRPYAKETAFSTWLELALQAADPRRSWEVVNCGGISYASYRLVNLFKECLGHSPDLFIVCTGHNEFLEDRSYEAIKRIPDSLAWSQQQASRLRLYRIARRWLNGEPKEEAQNRFVLPEEVEALLDYRGGLEVYDRNEKWTAEVIRHFGHNLRAMAGLAATAGVPMLFVRPPSDWRSTPPFKSQHRDGLSLDERLEWQSAVNLGRDAYGGDLTISGRHFNEALEIDDRYATLHFEIGKCHERLGRMDEARRAYGRALEEDVCPLRMTAGLAETMRRVAEEQRLELLDAHRLLERESQFGILGNDQLVDHVHPSIEGHQRIAEALLRTMEKAGYCRVTDGWEGRRNESYAEHFATLKPAYFAAARRALHGLNEWAAGRSEGPPLEAQSSRRR